jgi:predicted ribosomally synthesized peptide with nif11-like leader
MTSDALQRLKNQAAEDEELRAALVAATSRDDVVRIAGQYGVELDGSEVDAEYELSGSDVDDADLDGVVGGWHPKYGTFTDDCI